MNENPKLTKPEVVKLYREMNDLEQWVSPKVDPNIWPPKGWMEHPQLPGQYYRILTEEELREEIFGSEQKTEWLKQAARRIEEIKAALISYFFPKVRDEGTERKTKAGFIVMLKTGLSRKLDVAALASVVAECQKIAASKKLGLNVEASVIDWKPQLKLTGFRALPNFIQKEFEKALIIELEKPKFEILQTDETED